MANSTIQLGMTNDQITTLIDNKISATRAPGPVLNLNGTLIGSSFWKLGLLRVLIIAGIAAPNANTSYTVGTVPSGHRPVLQACAAYVPIVSGATKGYGRISVETGGQVTIISSFTGSQEIMAVITWIAAE